MNTAPSNADRTGIGTWRTLLGVLRHTWFLGFTSFGGPVVHFQIFHRKFVQGPNPWLTESMVSPSNALALPREARE